ncbi:MAG: hypothetical protein NVSMB32_18560 [Actinomycetota bacterium]
MRRGVGVTEPADSQQPPPSDPPPAPPDEDRPQGVGVVGDGPGDDSELVVDG